jgi:glycosyltransferase involved in cell wall biosynthesis
VIDCTKDNILVIIPVYNEATHIMELVSKIEEQGFYHICIVNDGSTDHFDSLVFSSSTNVLNHIINRGVGAATDTGFRFAKLKNYAAVITIDADMQHDVRDLDVLFEAFTKNSADIILGSRFLKTDNRIPRIRKFYNHFANFLVFVFSFKWVSDTQSGYKLISRRVLMEIPLRTDGYEFCSEFIIKALRKNFAIIEVPIHVYYTDYSLQKGQSFSNGYKTMIQLFSTLFFKE